jgi:hypothetical protein
MHAVSYFVETISYNPEARELHSLLGNSIFQITWSFQSHYCPGIYSASNSNEHPKRIHGNRARTVLKADNFTAICESIVQKIWDSGHLANLEASTACYGVCFNFCMKMMFVPHREHSYRLPRPVMGIAFTMVLGIRRVNLLLVRNWEDRAHWRKWQGFSVSSWVPENAGLWRTWPLPAMSGQKQLTIIGRRKILLQKGNYDPHFDGTALGTVTELAD